MEDAKIDAIAREVLTALKKSRAAEPAPVRPVSPAFSASASTALHPSLQLLSVVGGVVGLPCIVEPDKPCVGSLRCRTFGH